MELEDISPAAAIAGLVGAFIGYIMIARMGGADYNLGLIWKILTPLACGAGGFFIVQRMAD